jgi:hypothetical protein
MSIICNKHVEIPPNNVFRYFNNFRLFLAYHLHHVNPFNFVSIEKHRFFFVSLGFFKTQEEHTDEQIQEEETANENKCNEEIAISNACSRFRPSFDSSGISECIHNIGPTLII